MKKRSKILLTVSIVAAFGILIGILCTTINNQNIDEMRSQMTIKVLKDKYIWKSKRLRTYTQEALICNQIIGNCWNCKRVYKERKNYGMVAY